MASAADLLVTKGGELSLGMFPDDSAGTLTTKLKAWLEAGRTAGSAITDTDALETYATHYAYVLAYQAAINLRTEQESSASLATGESKSYGDSALAQWASRRDWHQGRVDLLTPTTPSGSVGDAQRRISTVRHTRYRW